MLLDAPCTPPMSVHTGRCVVSCRACSLNPFCIPHGLAPSEIEALDDIIERPPPIGRNSSVFRQGEDFDSIYIVRAGAFKLYTTSLSGEEQVVGFYLPGEIFGLDGIDEGVHRCTAKALTSSTICRIPYLQLQSLSMQTKGLNAHLWRLMSREIRSDQNLQLLLSRKSAEERLSSFLLNLAIHHQRRRLSPVTFQLPMSRSDIAGYLGLAVETVSRVFTRLCEYRIIEVDQREILIVNHAELCLLADTQCPQFMVEAFKTAARRSLYTKRARCDSP